MPFAMVDVVIVLLFALLAFLGWRKGFVRMAFGVVSFVVAILLARWLYPFVADWLSKTAFYTWCQGAIGEKLQGAEAPMQSGFLSMILGGGEALASSLTDLVMSVTAFLLVIVLVKLILWVVQFALHLFSKLPVVGFLNRLSGVALGLVEGYVIVSMLLAAIGVFSPLNQNEALMQSVEQSSLARGVTQNNPILTWMNLNP